MRRSGRTVDWPAIRHTARRPGALLLFGDEARFAPWGALGSTWAPRGQHPLVPTCGKWTGDKVFGLLDSFSERLCAHGHRGHCMAERSWAFLAT